MWAGRSAGRRVGAGCGWLGWPFRPRVARATARRGAEGADARRTGKRHGFCRFSCPCPFAPFMVAGRPGAGLMGVMRELWEDGDDETRRTIAKAW